MIAVPFPSPFDGSERLRGFRWGVVFRGDPPRTPRMDWAHTGGRWDRTARSAKRKKAVINRSVFASSAAPRGWEGRRPQRGWRSREGREVRGCDRAHLLSGSESSSGWREGCRREWRAHCPAGCEGGISSERDRLGRFLGPQGAVMCHSIGPSECEPHRPAGGCRRETAGTQAPGVLRKRVPVLGRE